MFDGKYVIWSYQHGAYWRSASAGYCTLIFGAGLYDRAEAEEIAREANRFSDRKTEEARDAETEFNRYLEAASPGTLGAAVLSRIGFKPGPDLVDRVARAIYAVELSRDDNCNSLVIKMGGNPHPTTRIETYEENAESWREYARAALDTARSAPSEATS
jgi:hypothetical protein